MSERIIEGRPRLPAPEARLALPPPDHRPSDGERDERRLWFRDWRIWVGLGILAALLAAALLWGGGAKEDDEGEARPPATISVATAREAIWADRINAVGTMVAVQGVDVTTELAGIVAAIRFANGGRAGRGQPLVDLDTTTEQAELAALVAQRDQARLAYDRARRLTERGAIADQEVELARANYQNLRARAEQVRTVIAKKRIEAPFAGDLGIRRVSVGQYVGPGTAVVSLQQIAPIFVNFELPEAAFPRVRAGQRIRITTGAQPGRSFEGAINAINPALAQATRAFTVQATVANADRALRPGMFADVTVLLPGRRRVLVVPATAVTTNAYGETVFLIAPPDPRREQQKRQREERKKEEQGFFARLFGGGSGSDGAGERSRGEGSGKKPQPRPVARALFVKTGERRGDDIEILRGLKPGQRVATSGLLKLEDDAPVQVSRRPAPAPSRPPQTP